MKFVRTEPGADPIIVEGHLPAPPSAVFQAWTQPESVKKWFGYQPGTLADAQIDLRPGGTWRFIERSDDDATVGFEGRYLDIRPDELLSFTWTKVSQSGDRATRKSDYSKVEIRLAPRGTGTDMTIVHSAIDDRDSRTGFSVGWEAGAANLAAFLSTRPTSR